MLFTLWIRGFKGLVSLVNTLQQFLGLGITSIALLLATWISGLLVKTIKLFLGQLITSLAQRLTLWIRGVAWLASLVNAIKLV